MKLKNKIVLSCVFGAVAGIAISVLITIGISLTVRDGRYYPVPPALTENSGSELSAVILQTVLSMLYGAVWGGASWIWRIDRWSILRQTLTHLAVCSAATFPVAYFAYWMPHSVQGVLVYFGIFAAIYLIIWVSQYSGMKKRVRQINERLNRDRT